MDDEQEICKGCGSGIDGAKVCTNCGMTASEIKNLTGDDEIDDGTELGLGPTDTDDDEMDEEDEM